MTSTQRQQFWQDHFSSWQRSGLGQRAYCEQQGLKLATFSYWRKRVPTLKPGSKLIALPVSSHTLIVLSAAGVRLEVPPSLLGEVLPVVWRSLREFS